MEGQTAMPCFQEVGEVVEASRELIFDWKIKDFFSLFNKTFDFYTSPSFSFDNSLWHLTLCLNIVYHTSEEQVVIYLEREDAGSPKIINFTMGIKVSGGVIRKIVRKHKFSKERVIRKYYFLSRSDLSYQKSFLMPNNVLTITCCLRNSPFGSYEGGQTTKKSKQPLGKTKRTKQHVGKTKKSKLHSLEVNNAVSSAFSSWECTSCWIQNPTNEKKCLTCGTLHPGADKTSNLKDEKRFELCTPVQNSPLTFKLENYVCTAASTTTTSSFTFSVASSQSQTTTSTTGFEIGVASSASSSFSSTTSTAKVTQIGKDNDYTGSSHINEIPVVGKDSVEESNTISEKNSASEGLTPVVKDVEENEVESIEDNVSTSLTTKTPEAASEQSETNYESKMLNSVINFSSETSVSKAEEDVTPVTTNVGFTALPLLASEKSEISPFPELITKDHLNSSSLPSPLGDLTPLPTNTDESTGDKKSLLLESESTIVSSESKTTLDFQDISEPQQVSSDFSALSRSPFFKFNEKTVSSKTNSTTIFVAPTSTTHTDFSFSNNESKDIKLFASETVSPFVKTEVIGTTPTTANTFQFGSTTTTSAFSLFPYFSTPNTVSLTNAQTLKSRDRSSFFLATTDQAVQAVIVGEENLRKSLLSMLESGDDSDIIIKVEGKEFPAHRGILRARSSFFRSMLAHEMEEKNSRVVNLEDCDLKTFPDFLVHMYSGSCNLSTENVCSLYAAADKYDVGDLKEACSEFLERNINVQRFCDIMTLAVKHNEEDLRKCATNFFCDNSLNIAKTSEWGAFIAEHPTVATELFLKAMSK